MNIYSKALLVFRKNYKPIPLEVFGKDSYKTLVSTLLSSRTRDEVNLIASQRLFNVAPTIKNLQQLDNLTIQQLIYPVGFYKTKARYLKKLSSLIINKYNGKIPDTREELVKLPGVGRKTANLVLNRAFGISAIAVDTHVHRISNLLGWVKTKTPEQTEKALINILPKKYWSDVNRLFVSIGQQYRNKEKLVEFLKSNRLLT